MNYDPVQGEFFTGKDIVDRLVRETLQNSLDARNGSGRPVRVRFAIHSDEPDFSSDKQDFYFSGLIRHLRECKSGRYFELSKQPLSYLVIEDFETTGLTGDPKQTNDEKDNNFYYFFRNVGRSGKGEDKGGSWGLGKWVFPDASRLNAFFALTRRGDGDVLFMGQAVLTQHTIDDEKYDPYGFFSKIEDNESGLQIPFNAQEDWQIVKTFEDDFNLKRNDETGLSIVVPFLSEDEESQSFGPEDIVRSVIKYYFYPIVSNDLVVEVCGSVNEWFSGKEVLNHDSIEDIVTWLSWPDHREIGREDLKHLIEIAMDRLTIEESKWHKLEYKGRNRSMNMKELIGSKREDLIKLYNSDKRLYLKIPVEVKEKKSKKISYSYFTAIIQKDKDVEQGKDYYVRGNLAIQDIDTVRQYPVRVLVHIEEKEILAHLLRDTEGPSHSNWRPNAPRAKEKYANVYKTVNMVKNAVKDILSVLSEDNNESVQEDAFIDFFYYVKKREIGSNNGELQTSPTPDVNPDGKLNLFKIERTRDGFAVSMSDGQDVPYSIRIDLAYNSKKNPLSQYSPLDFELDKLPISIKYEKCSCEGEKNRLVVKNIEEDFKVTVMGFDIHRDLYIKAEVVENGEGEDD